MKFLKLLAVTLIPLSAFSQESSNSKIGKFELGIRNTISTFGSSGNVGYGFGGQFRVRVTNRINTEWFADYITEDIEGLAKRTDHHIGWSVMFYPLNPENKRVIPYLLGGHCFDYTKISPTYSTTNSIQQQEKSRLSSATQVGIGTHIYLTDQFNISGSAQYMIHLGEDIHTEIHRENGHEEIHIDNGEHSSSIGIEGHVLFTISLNFKIIP